MAARAEAEAACRAIHKETGLPAHDVLLEGGGPLVTSLAPRIDALFHGFVLQKLWDPKVPLEPYLAALDALLAGLVVGKQKRRTNAAR